MLTPTAYIVVGSASLRSDGLLSAPLVEKLHRQS
jgi:hypothetical protein